MKKLLLLLALVFCFGLFAVAQDQPAPAQSGGDTTAAPAGQATDQSTAAPADQATKADKSDMKGAKEKSMKGCLSGPDASGNYTLTRGKKTVTVAANDELKNHVGHEVKLTGTKSGDTFTATKIDHISDTCTAGAKAKKDKDTMGGDTNPK